MNITNDEPLVSVVIAFLNPGSWLAEAVESVIKQSYKNWQLILVDDGSVAQDSGVALNYSKQYPGKIIYVEHPNHINKGVTISRNVGIANATGEYVAFLDADDCWLPEKLEKQLAIFQLQPLVEMVCEASWFWYTWAHPDTKNYLQLIGAQPGIYYPPQLMQLLYPLGEGNPPCPSGIIIKKKTLSKVGGFEESFSGVYQLYEDQAFLSKVYANAVVYISGQANNMYRKRENSMSSAINDKVIYKKVRLFYLCWLKEYFLSSKVTPSLIQNLIEDFRSQLNQQVENVV